MELKLLYLKHYKLFQKKLRVEKQLGCVFFSPKLHFKFLIAL